MGTAGEVWGSGCCTDCCTLWLDARDGVELDWVGVMGEVLGVCLLGDEEGWLDVFDWFLRLCSLSCTFANMAWLGGVGVLARCMRCLLAA